VESDAVAGFRNTGESVNARNTTVRVLTRIPVAVGDKLCRSIVAPLQGAVESYPFSAGLHPSLLHLSLSEAVIRFAK
jgi:hypothetical protein